MIGETFIIIKPDAISRGLTHTIVERFQQLGHIIWVAGRIKNREWCRQHYAHIFNNPEFKNDYVVMETFMAETLLISFSLAGINVIKKAREITGATRISDAVPGTIRGDLGMVNKPMCYNLVHTADSTDAVQREYDLFFDRSTDYKFGIITDE